LELIISDLQNNNQQLKKRLAVFREQGAAFASLQKATAENQKVIQAAKNKSRQMGLKVHELTRECEKLRIGLVILKKLGILNVIHIYIYISLLLAIQREGFLDGKGTVGWHHFKSEERQAHRGGQVLYA